MSGLHLQIQVHRGICRHQPQRRWAISWYPSPDTTEEAAVFCRRRKGIVTCALVQIQRCSASKYESKANVYVDFWKGGLKVQELWELSCSVSRKWRACFCVRTRILRACVVSISCTTVKILKWFERIELPCLLTAWLVTRKCIIRVYDDYADHQNAAFGGWM